MSSYEQRKEPWSRDWQYLLFAAEPYVGGAADRRLVLPLACLLAARRMPAVAGERRAPLTRASCSLAHAPQEVIAFKIPSYEVEKHPERLFTHWCAALQLPTCCCLAVVWLLSGCCLGGRPGCSALLL